MELHNFWFLDEDEQNAIREIACCETEEEHQAFLNALFPVAQSWSEAEKRSGTDNEE